MGKLLVTCVKTLPSNVLVRFWTFNESSVIRTRESLEKNSCDATLKGEVVSTINTLIITTNESGNEAML